MAPPDGLTAHCVGVSVGAVTVLADTGALPKAVRSSVVSANSRVPRRSTLRRATGKCIPSAGISGSFKSRHANKLTSNPVRKIATQLLSRLNSQQA
jgi:hypothetical protein